MDPITAAGIGLSVTSLALQVFSGCIKGYQMFVDVVGMPKEYEHLRTRLRMEQTRCLLWGEKVGLIEELLDEPSKLLQLNGNLVLDLLQQIQVSFRLCLAVTSKYDPMVAVSGPEKSGRTAIGGGCTKTSFLQKTLAIWDRGGRIVTKVEWATIRKGGLEKLITRLIQYNDRIEGLLDRQALEEIQVSQLQSNLTLLQMAEQMGQITSLLSAMHFAQRHQVDDEFWQLSRAATANENDKSTLTVMTSLAAFKAHHLRIELDPAPGTKPGIPFAELSLDGDAIYAGRQSGRWKDQSIWLEWREDIDQAMSRRDYERTVVERVKKLATILAAPDRPKAFRSPQCLGYCRSSEFSKPRYALIYEWPKDLNNAETGFETLRALFTVFKKPPTLDARLAMARALAASLLYLHAVGWVHKDMRSDNVLFASSADGSVDPYEPLLSGFEFARPSLPEQVTVPHQFSAQHDLYRHPDLQKPNPERSRKLHDIYSLGLVLAEVALWQPIEVIAGIEVRRRYLPDLQTNIFDKRRDVFGSIAERAGWKYADIVRDCLEGPSAFGLSPKVDDERSEVAAQLTNAFHRQVVQKLENIKI